VHRDGADLALVRTFTNERPARLHLALLPVVLVTLASVVVLVGFLLASRGGDAGTASDSVPDSLRALAAEGGCRLLELDLARQTNPPTTGEFLESDRVADADYSGTAPPPLKATLHAMLHGRVLFQFSADARDWTRSALRRLYAEDADKVLLFQNQTRMPYEAAATAYLSAIVCPRLTPAGVDAFRAFRERRRDFAQLA
jgi:hypothetical protein